MDESKIDQMIDALELEELERATAIVQNATGATNKQAMDVVLTFLEGLDEAEDRGLNF